MCPPVGGPVYTVRWTSVYCKAVECFLQGDPVYMSYSVQEGTVCPVGRPVYTVK